MTSSNLGLFTIVLALAVQACDHDHDSFTLMKGDCRDDDADVNPDATEIPYNGVDDDCAGGDLVDVDGDRVVASEVGGTDCNDADVSIYPGAEEVPYDGIDQDCAGDDLVDVDHDGSVAVEAGGDDCDDVDAHVAPTAVDLVGDNLDQNCDAVDGVDSDGDGVAASWSGGLDCDDQDPEVHPGAPDDWYDGFDANCSGNDFDLDGDGYSDPLGGGDDCDDLVSAIHPGAAELYRDGVDQDCDGVDGTDTDQDGFASVYSGGEDCDDFDASVRPDAAEVWYDGVDQDCDANDLDQDADGYDAATHGGDDCDDLDPTRHPGAPDAFGDAIDQDCSGSDGFDGDLDGEESIASGGQDCDDADPTVYPGAEEVAGDGIDQDCNGTDKRFFVQVEVGPNWSCALDSAGFVTCWGSTYVVVNAPTQPIAKLGKWSELGSSNDGDDCAFGIDLAGDGISWGYCSVSLLQSDGWLKGPFRDLVSQGYGGTLGVKTDGTAGVVLAGSGLTTRTVAYGALSIRRAASYGGTSYPYQTALCALLANGGLTCVNPDTGAASIYPLAPPSGSFSQLDSRGLGGFCALRTSGFPACWGGNSYFSSSPNFFLSAPPQVPMQSLSAGTNQACGVLTDGGIQCWSTLANNGIVNGVPSDKGYIDVTVGSQHACALKADGSVTCWGDNTQGEVSSTPAP